MSLIFGSGNPACFIAIGFECVNDFDCPVNEFCDFDGVCVFFGFFDRNAECIGDDCPTPNAPPPVAIKGGEEEVE